MKLKDGELYFIGETDVLTGEPSGYFKIGKVKDSRAEGVAGRLKEHQTGNPRHLGVVECVITPAIDDLESSMHNRFAIDRVRGEWFELSSERLTDAVRVAQTLAAEQTNHVRASMIAAGLDSQLSNGDVRPPTEEDLAWHRRRVAAKALSKRVGRLSNGFEAVVRAAIAEGHDVSRFALLTESVGSRFDKRKFAEAHPELVESFTTVQPTFSHRFIPSRAAAEVEAVELEMEFVELERRMVAVMGPASSNLERLEELHLIRLELKRFEEQADWAKDIAETNLKVSCGLSSGVEGLCTWNRRLVESEKFDEASFKVDHPDLHAQFTVPTLTPRFNLVPDRGYLAPR